jgi:preprotein translocase subunit Sss1
MELSTLLAGIVIVGIVGIIYKIVMKRIDKWEG